MKPEPSNLAANLVPPTPPALASVSGSANTVRKPVDIAHEWLKKSRQESCGHISKWSPETMGIYHHDLGLLVDFVTDCWPNDGTEPLRAGRKE